MPFVQVFLLLIVVGVVLWLINSFIPMAASIKSILNAVVVIAVIVWLLNVFGLLTSVVTSKAANGGHFKTGQRMWPGTRWFYAKLPCSGKSVFVRQLRGPHLRT